MGEWVGWIRLTLGYNSGDNEVGISSGSCSEVGC